MPKQPWLSILSGSVESPARTLDFAAALESPCATCQTAPCCTYLPLFRFRVDTLMQLDHARYLLNFDRIELGLSASGDWSVYYRYPCRQLDRTTFQCTVHDTEAQPDICKNFNPHSCWYKRSLRAPVTEAFLRIDRPRLEFILERVTLDEERNVVSVPDWESMSAAFREMPADAQRTPDEQIGHDPVLARWREQIISPGLLVRRQPAAPPPVSYHELDEPCVDCGASCCSTLVFPHGYPTTRGNLDYLRFVLGFPGIEVGVHDAGWSIVVKTQCRFLVGNRCGVFGKPERPLLCRYYDAHSCAYKVHFEQPRPQGYVRVRHEDFEAMARLFQFDATGAVVALPPADAVRASLEDAWRAAAPPEPAPVPGAGLGGIG
jgi:Fe-S-cluster containining protein